MKIAIIENVGPDRNIDGPKNKGMEDRHFLIQSFMDTDSVLGGVFDGHIGKFASDYASKRFPEVFKTHLSKGIKEAFVFSFAQVSDELAAKDPSGSGTTATVFLIQDGTIHVANVGDSKAIIVTDNEMVTLTEDHRTSNPDELDRISHCKGILFSDLKTRKAYVAEHGTKYGLEPTRSLGDIDYMKAGIIDVPHVSTHKISSQDLYLVSATDGLWDFLEDWQVAIKAREIADPEILVQKLNTHVFADFWGHDNLTIIAVRLKE
ncbi:MAG: hypothetical protein UT18_C0022G0002 [candidate division CPR2 bacterium GW2011_GWC2_39_10]|uniref:PPM-type phosphatase domain-containing protein n=1 Tax=candidate division CPR2 bacterium GW2011_GWC2_39_10 TaxID=1618345 RepID=A0A0G0LN57_UNCC2|nr:MAG: hypothetical protein UT18_C0022G0002 [candidate division CPR2 bacterium GW2011_GWC2_39_10]